MSKFYFYCPNCGFEKEVNKLLKEMVDNLCDSFEIGLYQKNRGFVKEIYYGE